ncbi:uncharacterized protein [Clytia hemisphaerica]|uniref:Uncharacterized protein n=1 Tax=Clytia hemisphaerica TaxID=252671 RepID=A0A7M5UHK9_9CNID
MGRYIWGNNQELGDDQSSRWQDSKVDRCLYFMPGNLDPPKYGFDLDDCRGDYALIGTEKKNGACGGGSSSPPKVGDHCISVLDSGTNSDRDFNAAFPDKEIFMAESQANRMPQSTINAITQSDVGGNDKIWTPFIWSDTRAWLTYGDVYVEPPDDFFYEEDWECLVLESNKKLRPETCSGVSYDTLCFYEKDGSASSSEAFESSSTEAFESSSTEAFESSSTEAFEITPTPALDSDGMTSTYQYMEQTTTLNIEPTPSASIVAPSSSVSGGGGGDRACRLDNVTVTAKRVNAQICIQKASYPDNPLLSILKTFPQAAKYCGELQGELLQFPSQAAYDILADFITADEDLKNIGTVHLGGHDFGVEGQVLWLDGTNGTELTIQYTNGLTINVLSYLTTTRTVGWASATASIPFICQWKRDRSKCALLGGYQFGDRCFRHLSVKNGAKYSADGLCTEWHTDATLFTPLETPKEMSFLQKSLKDVGVSKVWMGATYDVDTWVWADSVSRPNLLQPPSAPLFLDTCAMLDVNASPSAIYTTFICIDPFSAYDILCQLSISDSESSTTTTTPAGTTTTTPAGTTTTTTDEITTTTPAGTTTTTPVEADGITTTAADRITTEAPSTATTTPGTTIAPVNGYWTDFELYEDSKCSKTCGLGIILKKGVCVPPVGNGAPCDPGLDIKAFDCNPHACPEPCDLPNSPPGFFKFGSKCIKIEEENVTLNYVEGLAHCAKEYGGELLTLHSAEETTKIFDYVGNVDNFLTASTDKLQQGILTWQDGFSGSPVDYITQSPGDNKHCLRLNGERQMLEWSRCGNKVNRVICQLREAMSDCTKQNGFQYKTKCYREFNDGQPSHAESADICKGWSSTATLFMPDSGEEIDFIKDYMAATEYAVWVDGTDLETEGSLVWRDSRVRNHVTIETGSNTVDKDCLKYWFKFQYSVCESDQPQWKKKTLCQIGTDEIVSAWSRWSDCPLTCKRGKMKRIRMCYYENKHDIEKDTCEGLPLTEEEDCLVRENCGSGYYLADPGLSCAQFCPTKDGMGCLANIETGNSANGFDDVILSYTTDASQATWQRPYGPGCLAGDICVEYQDVPEEVSCDEVPVTAGYRRLCNCLGTDDVGFGGWSPWSECSATCNGTRSRERTCFSTCTGPEKEFESCGAGSCPIHGGISQWSSWTNCDVTCGGGRTTRTRACDNPEPKYDGNGCVASLEQSDDCGVINCPVDATWAEWSPWSACDKACNTGHYVRRRNCNPANYGGIPCSSIPGEPTAEAPCNEFPCNRTYANLVLHFNQDYESGMEDPNNFEYIFFRESLRAEINSVYEDGGEVMQNEVLGVDCHNLEEGSVIANFTINYASMDKEQFLFFQDILETSIAVGKMELVNGMNMSLTIGPDLLSEPPPNVTAHSPSPEVLIISWDAIQNTDLDAYVVFYRERLLSSQPYFKYATVNTSAHLTWLKPGTEYVYRVLGYSVAKGNGIASMLDAVWTMEKLPQVSPSNVTAEGSGPFEVYLTWVRVPDDQMNGIPLGYNIYAYHNGAYVSNETAPFDYSGWSFTKELEPSTSYVFDVCAFNSAGDSPCDRANARTLDSAPSAPPQNIYISSIKTQSQLTIHWSPPPPDRIHGDLLAYKLKVFAMKTGADVYIDPKVDVYDLHPGFTSYTLRFLTTNTFYSFEILAVNQFGEGVSDEVVGRTCPCPAVVSSNFYLYAPYLTRDSEGKLASVFGDVLDAAISATCGVCNTPNGPVYTKLDKMRNGRLEFAEKSLELKVLKEVDEYTDLSFPIIGNTYSDEMVGYPFVPLVGHPGVVAIVRDKNINEIVIEMIMMILGIYPLIGLNLLMMIAAGYVVWLLEACNSDEGSVDFSNSWIRGIYEGWYWAFITQGTHGYGDFAPTKVGARIFAMIWALVGLVMTGIVIGAIVTALTTVNGAAQFKIYGSQVGALNGTFEAKLGLLRNGKVNEKKAYLTVEELRDALLNNDVEGVLLDAYTAGANADLFADERLRAATLLEYPRSYGFVLSGGLRSVAAEFKSFMKSDEDRILSILTNSTEPMGVAPPAELKSPFDPESSILATALISMTVMLVVFSILGFIWSHFLKKINAKKEQILDPKDVLAMCNLLVEDFKETMDSKMVDLEDKHLLQRELLYKDYHGHSAIEHHKMNGDKLQKMLDAKLMQNRVAPCPDSEQLVDEMETGRLSVASSVASSVMSKHILETSMDEETNVESEQTPPVTETPIESFDDEQYEEFENSEDEIDQQNNASP